MVSLNQETRILPNGRSARIFKAEDPKSVFNGLPDGRKPKRTSLALCGLAIIFFAAVQCHAAQDNMVSYDLTHAACATTAPYTACYYDGVNEGGKLFKVSDKSRKSLAICWASHYYQFKQCTTLEAENGQRGACIQVNKAPFNENLIQPVDDVVNNIMSCTWEQKGRVDKSWKKGDGNFQRFKAGLCAFLRSLNATHITTLQYIEDLKASWTYVPFLVNNPGNKVVIDMGSGKFTIYSDVGAPMKGLKVDTPKKGEAKYVDSNDAVVQNGKASDAARTLQKMESIIEEILAREDSPDTIEIYATGVWRTEDQCVANFIHIRDSLVAKFGRNVITVMRPITGGEECTWGSKSIMELKGEVVPRTCFEQGFDEVLVIESGNGSTQHATYSLNEAGQRKLAEREPAQVSYDLVAAGCELTAPYKKCYEGVNKDGNLFSVSAESRKSVAICWASHYYQFKQCKSLEAASGLPGACVQVNKQPFRGDLIQPVKDVVRNITECSFENRGRSPWKEDTVANRQAFNAWKAGLCDFLYSLKATHITSLQFIEDLKASWTYVPFLVINPGNKVVIDMGSGKFTIYSNVGAPMQGLKTVDTQKKGEAKYMNAQGMIVENGKDSNATTTLSKMEIIIEEILAREDSPDTIEIYATGVWRTDDQCVANFLHIKESLEAKFGTHVITVMRPITGEEECTWGSKSIMELKDEVVPRTCFGLGFDEVLVIESGNGSTQHARYVLNRCGREQMMLMQREAAQAQKAATTVEDEKSAHNVVSVSPKPQPRATSPKPAPIDVRSQSPRAPPSPRAEGTPKSSLDDKLGAKSTSPRMKKFPAAHFDPRYVGHGTVASMGAEYLRSRNETRPTSVEQADVFAVGDIVTYFDAAWGLNKAMTVAKRKNCGNRGWIYDIEPLDGGNGGLAHVAAHKLKRTRRRVLEQISHDIETAKRM